MYYMNFRNMFQALGGRKKNNIPHRVRPHIYGRARKVWRRAGKFGVPRPVRGSQPVVAKKPEVPQPELLPTVISWKLPGWAYSVGLTKPTVFLPALILSSLILVRIDAKTGVAAEVPPIKVSSPSRTMTTLSPTAETSG